MVNKHILSGLVSYIIWGFVVIVFRELKSYNPYEVITFRMVFAFGIMSFVLLPHFKDHIAEIKLLLKRPRREKIKFISLTIFGGLCISANWTAFIYIINDISISAGAFAYLVLPIVTAFLAFFILKEQLTRSKWIGIGLGIISCFLIGNVNADQLLWVSSATLSYSFFMISQRANTFFSRKLLVSLHFSIGTILLLSLHPVSIADKDSNFWINIAIFSSLFTVIPLLLNLFALKGMESSQVAFLIYINPIISFVIGFVLYNESINFTEMIAFLILGLAIICFNWSLIQDFFRKKRLL